ncbi:hypothetical protein [Saccharothrix stipae]
MPPPRRRPVPTTPTTRPRVAGLRKRPEQGTTPGTPEAAPVEDAQVEDTRPEGSSAEGSSAAGSGTAVTEDPRTSEPTAAGSTPAESTAKSAGAEPTDVPAEPTGPADARSTEVTGLIEPREDAEDEDETPEPAPRPRPTGRRKRTGEAVAPSVLTDHGSKHAKPGADPDADADTDHARGSGRTGLVLPIALVVVAGLLVALGVWFQSRADDVHYNQALVDSAGTTEVAGQTREAIEKAFSYNFADVAATEKAANELLVGKAQCQYNAIFDPVRKLAPEQKLVVTVKAVSSGVTTLDGDHATVLLFLDQVTTRTTDNQSGGGIAMMRVSARKVDGRWKVDNMEMFGQSGDQSAETAKC